jgi:hypothetical protein
MKFTLLFQYWEEGSRPGFMKLNLVNNESIIDVADLDAALKVLQNQAAHAIRISYHQVRFHSAYLFEDEVDCGKGANPFFNRKRWTVRNEEVCEEYDRWTIGSERPGFWATLNPQQQNIVGKLDRQVSTKIAGDVAREFDRANRTVNRY